MESEWADSPVTLGGQDSNRKQDHWPPKRRPVFQLSADAQGSHGTSG